MTFPGPDLLGRGLVVAPGAGVPPGWEAVGRVRVDDETLVRPAAAAQVLHACWAGRRRVVVELAVDAAGLKEPEREVADPYRLGPSFRFERERLHFLVWANTYDARSGEPRWWHGVRAARLGATEGGPADVVLSDGRPAWCDGGPRQPLAVPHVVVHRDSIDSGRLTPARFRPPAADLAPDQLAAVAHPGGPARVIAPAGSGKTRVLTERLRHLLADRSHEPDLVTAVAYNVKAADELRQRTAGLAPTIRTLNSFGLHVCRMAGNRRVVEEREVRAIVESLVRLPRQVNADPLAPWLDALSAIRLGLLDPEEAEARYPDAVGVADVFPAYREALAKANALDFDEQIYLAVELCLADADVRARARAGARTLLVDEFQDLTPAHLLLLRLVAGPAADVFGVGDDDQVIYGYAGADPSFLLHFDRYFPGAAAYDLQVNYRCPPSVVEATNTLLGYNRRRIVKEVRPAPGRGPEPDELEVRRVAGDVLAPTVGDQVAAWVTAGTKADDVAVLARVNSVLLPVQVLLTERGLPCTRAVGPEVLARTGTAAALAYLRIGLSPDAIARADVTATVRRPSRKIARNVIDMVTKRPHTSLGELRRLADWLTGDDAVRVAGYADDLASVHEAVAGGDTAAALRVIRARVGLGGAMADLDASRTSLDRSSHGDDLWALEQVARLHPDPATFEAWLRRTLQAAAGTGVHLSTVHKVKGREWPRVVVFGASADLLPHRLAEDVEEERRVFHVALTRARRAVIVVADAAAPSVFLDELAGTARRAPVTPEPAARQRERERPAPERRQPRAAGGASTPTRPAEVGLQVTLPGGIAGEVADAGPSHAVVIAAGGRRLTVPYGTAVRTGGRSALLMAPGSVAEAGFEALRSWRAEQARRDGVPAYVVMSDAHLRGVAERRPATLAQLAACPGIGPARLERYGDEILAVLEGAGGEGGNPS